MSNHPEEHDAHNHLVDPKFKSNPGRYIGQSVMVMVVLFAILRLLDAGDNAAVIGALGATTFIAFTMPHAHRSRARYILGGYAVGILVGVFCNYLEIWSHALQHPFFEDSSQEVFGAMAVGISIFLMVILNLEHPPAAGVALGLALNPVIETRTVFIITIGVLSIAAAKTLLRPLLLDLL